MLQFVTIKFRPGDKREFAYVHEGPEQIEVGDRVDVPGRGDDVTVRVLAVSTERPAHIPAGVKFRRVSRVWPKESAAS